MLRDIRHKELLPNHQKKTLRIDAINFFNSLSKLTEFEIDTILHTCKSVMFYDNTMWKKN